MVLNKQKGNMYPWVTHTWNPIKGKCPHDCSYCYMKRFPIGELRLDRSCFDDNLGKNNIIFVGSSTDMFANVVSDEWIEKVFNYILKFPDNVYLFQSKNPERFNHIAGFPPNTIWGTTIETNRDGLNHNLKVPSVFERRNWLSNIDGKKMVSIEPIMDFDLKEFVDMIFDIRPEFVSIGADSQNHNLPEPSKEKVLDLIDGLKIFTEIKIKDNLKRIIEG